mgnify:CR=1 FL=1
MESQKARQERKARKKEEAESTRRRWIFRVLLWRRREFFFAKREFVIFFWKWIWIRARRYNNPIPAAGCITVPCARSFSICPSGSHRFTGNQKSCVDFNTPLHHILQSLPDYVVFNEIRFIEELGRGSRGVVSLGEWRGSPVAIKKVLKHPYPSLPQKQTHPHFFTLLNQMFIPEVWHAIYLCASSIWSLCIGSPSEPVRIFILFYRLASTFLMYTTTRYVSHHPHVASFLGQTYDPENTAMHIYIIYEYYANQSLIDYLRYLPSPRLRHLN